jgi:hypothetical protein
MAIVPESEWRTPTLIVSCANDGVAAVITIAAPAIPASNPRLSNLKLIGLTPVGNIAVLGVSKRCAIRNACGFRLGEDDFSAKGRPAERDERSGARRMGARFPNFLQDK